MTELQPEPPVNVRLVLANNQEVPVDTVYVGQDEDGLHQWEIVNAPTALRIMQMKIDRLPARTAISIPGGLV